jgi:hypothetical protein
VGVTGAKGGRLRSIVVGGRRRCVRWRQWLEVAEAEVVGGGRRIGRRREREKFLGEKNENFETTLSCFYSYFDFDLFLKVDIYGSLNHDT